MRDIIIKPVSVDSQPPLPDARRTIPEAPKGNRRALKHGRQMIEAERRKLGQYWFQDGRKFAQCFQDPARCIPSKIDQDGHPLSSPAGPSQRGYPVPVTARRGTGAR
jgi:hypothetical protein